MRLYCCQFCHASAASAAAGMDSVTLSAATPGVWLATRGSLLGLLPTNVLPARSTGKVRCSRARSDQPCWLAVQAPPVLAIGHTDIGYFAHLNMEPVWLYCKC
jgi:hypothetical protein